MLSAAKHQRSEASQRAAASRPSLAFPRSPFDKPFGCAQDKLRMSGAQFARGEPVEPSFDKPFGCAQDKLRVSGAQFARGEPAHLRSW